MNFLPKILFVSPGYKPVPDVAGGAVEHLMTQIIDQNEKTPLGTFELVTVRDKRIDSAAYKHTRITQIRDFRRTFFLRAFSFVLNGVYSLLHTNLRYSYLGRKAVQAMSDDTAFILVENDVNIFKQIVQLRPKKPVVFHMHNDFDTFGEMQKTRASMRYVLEHAAEIWTVSTYLKRHLLAEFPDADEVKIRVLENCIDRKRFSPAEDEDACVAEFRAKYGIAENDFVILYAGRILPQKGVLELIQAVALLPLDMDYKLLIVGDLAAASREYKKCLEKAAAPIQEKVIFAGYVPQYEIQTAYAVPGIVAVPSQCQEAFCLTALEASCHCKPCVASKSGGLADVLDDSCARLIPLGEEEKILCVILPLPCMNCTKTKRSVHAWAKMQENAQPFFLMRRSILTISVRLPSNFCMGRMLVLDFASVWLLLLGVRECANIFTPSTTVLTLLITSTQFLHLLFLLEKDGWRFTWYHLLLVWFVLLTAYNPGTLPTVNIVLAIILLQKTPVQKVSFVMTVAFFVTLFVYLSAFSLGILQDGTTQYAKGLTHSLGFRNSNTPGLLFMMLTLVISTFCLQTFRLKFPMLLFLLPNYLIFTLTLGRTSFATVCLYFFLVWWFSFRRRYALERRFATVLPILLFAVTFVFLHIWYKIPFVNVFFTGRFRINGNTLKNLSAANYVLGYRLPEGPMDSAYLGILLNGGVMCVWLFLSSCVRGIRNMPIAQAKVFLPFVIVFAVSGFTEGTFSLFRLATVLFYKILSDHFPLRPVRASYLKPIEVNNE